jgi:hypothetical protein
MQPLDLFGKSEIQSRTWTARAPVLILQRFNAGDGKVEVRGGNAHTQTALDNLKQGRKSCPDAGASHDAAHAKYLNKLDFSTKQKQGNNSTRLLCAGARKNSRKSLRPVRFDAIHVSIRL